MKLKYLAAILLIGANCFASDIYEPIKLGKKEVVFSNSSKEISVIDPTIASNSRWSNFPGGRGPNQLVIYTPKFGDRTNTNEYGSEALVQNGIVTVLSSFPFSMANIAVIILVVLAIGALVFPPLS